MRRGFNPAEIVDAAEIEEEENENFYLQIRNNFEVENLMGDIMKSEEEFSVCSVEDTDAKAFKEKVGKAFRVKVAKKVVSVLVSLGIEGGAYEVEQT